MPETAAASSPAQLAKVVETYLADHPTAAILEDGHLLFDMRTARYSIAESHGRCILQLWSEERNLVRTIVGIQPRAATLRLLTRKMGAPKPITLELVPHRDQRTPTAREAARKRYLRTLERVLQRAFPDWKQEGFRTAADLEHSFGPAYIRGKLLRGPAAEAIIGVAAEESSTTVDGILALGLLWLDLCRENPASGSKPPGKSGKGTSQGHANRHFGALKIIVPEGMWRTTAERMAWLHHGMARFQLFALDERSEELREIDFRDTGNLYSRLTHAFDPAATIERANPSIARVLDLVPEGAVRRIETRAHSATEVGLLLHGLEFARVRSTAAANSFAREEQITFGAGPNETTLTPETELLCRQLLSRLFLSRHPDGQHIDPLFRLQPERWLESRLRLQLAELLPGLRGEFLYSQVPAITSGDRGMLDLLTIDPTGRLAVIEIKADEDLHLPLQGLDYWIRVRALNAARAEEGNRSLGALERHGYFPGIALSERPPRLLLIAPTLRIHPSNETVLRYLSPEIEWELIAVSEHWRRELKVVFRKRPGNKS